MYYYVGFKTLEDINIKSFYFDSIVSSSNYLIRIEDNVKDKIIELLKNNYDNFVVNGYLVLDDISLRQIKYLFENTEWVESDEINTSIIERLAKQVILLDSYE